MSKTYFQWNFSIFLIIFLCSNSISAQLKPNLNNTGTQGVLVEYTGDSNITEEGAIIENYIINGSLNIKADNVTVRNCLINTTGTYGIRDNYGNKGLLIEDCEIRGMTSAAIIGGDFIARRCNIWNSGADGIKPTKNFVIENCYFHHLGYIATSHADGVQMVAGSNGIIRGNNFDMPYNEPNYKNSQCLILSTNNGTLDNIEIDSNWINGGGYSIQIRDKNNGYGDPTNMSITNNLFGRDHQFDHSVLDGDVAWNCNRWEDTEELIGECDALGVEDIIETSKFFISQNPVISKFQILSSEGVSFEIYNINGALKQQNRVTSNQHTVDISRLSSGTYFVKMYNDRNFEIKKVIKK